MLRYKLIASDFDGTLRHTDGEVSEETKETVREFTSRGGIFALCTGRMTASILPRAREMGLNGLAVAYQGGVIVDTASGKILRDERIPCSDTVEICRFLEQDNHLHVYDGDRFFVNENDGFLAMYERICRVHGILTPRAVSRTVEAEHVSANKIVAMCEAEKQAELLSRCRAGFGDRYYITSSMEQMVEIAPKGVDKGTALDFMASYYGIPLDSLVPVVPREAEDERAGLLARLQTILDGCSSDQLALICLLAEDVRDSAGPSAALREQK